MKSQEEQAGLADVPHDLVSVAEAAKMIGITERTIWRKIREGQIRAWGMRRYYRVSLGDLLSPVMVERKS